MEVPRGCRVESYGLADPEKKVLIIDHHGATWEAFTKAYAADLAAFSNEELEALRDYCNYHRDKGVPEMAKEVATQISKLREDVRVDIFSVVGIPRAIVDTNRVNFEGERPAFPLHIAKKFDLLSDRFRQFHFDVQEWIELNAKNYDLVLDLHSMNGWDLNEEGKMEELHALKEKDFVKRLKRLVEIGTSKKFLGKKRENNLFSKDFHGEVIGSGKFNAFLQKYFSGGGFCSKIDKPYHFLSLIFSSKIANLLKSLGVVYGIIDVNIADIADSPNTQNDGLVHLDPIFDYLNMGMMSEAIAYAICDTLQPAK